MDFFGEKGPIIVVAWHPVACGGHPLYSETGCNVVLWIGFLSFHLIPPFRCKTAKKKSLFQQQHLPVSVVQELQSNLLRKQVTRR